MPRTRECDYCGDDIEPGTGTMFVHTDGTTVHYCSAKCEKNADLGREPRSREWTAAGQAQGGAVVTQAEPRAEAAAGDEAGETEADAPDLEAAEGSTELDEPEPEPDVDTDVDTEAESEPVEPEQGDEDEEPVVDAGGGKEAEGAEDTESEETEE